MLQLQFVMGTGLTSRIIEYFGHGVSVSHVDTVMPDGRLLGARNDKIGNVPAGVQLRDPSYTGTEAVLRINIAMPGDMMQDYLNFITEQLGKPYDKLGIVSFFLGRNWDDLDSWFCSELVAAGLVKCGYFKYPLATPSNKITPPDLLLLLSVQDRVKIR